MPSVREDSILTHDKKGKGHLRRGPSSITPEPDQAKRRWAVGTNSVFPGEIPRDRRNGQRRFQMTYPQCNNTAKEKEERVGKVANNLGAEDSRKLWT